MCWNVLLLTNVYIIFSFPYWNNRDLRGGLMAKTPCSQCRGPGYNLWSGNWIPPATHQSLQSAPKDPACCNEGQRFCVPQRRPSEDKFKTTEDFLGGSVVKKLPANAGDTRDMGWVHGLGPSLRKGNGKPLQYSCLGNLMDRGAWQATVHGVAKCWTPTEQLSPFSLQPWANW